MQGEFTYFCFGIGVAIIIFILDKTMKTIPRWSVIISYGIAALLLGLGFLTLFDRFSVLSLSILISIIVVSVIFALVLLRHFTRNSQTNNDKSLRIGIRGHGGKLQLKHTKISGQDVSMDTKDTDVDSDDLDIK